MNRRFNLLPKTYTIALVVAFVLAWTPLAFASPLLLVFVLSRLLNLKWGFWTSFVAAFPILAAFFACVAGVAWLIKAPLIAPYTTDFAVVALAITASLYNPKALPSLRPTRQDIQNIDDWLALGAAVIAMFIVCIPLLPRPSVATAAPFIMYGGDNSAHLRMVETVSRNQGYAIGHHNRENLNGILVAYPQGWHFVTAYAQDTVNQTFSVKAKPGLILAIFYGMCVLWWGTLVFFIARLSLLCLTIEAKKRSTQLLTKMAVVIVGLLGALGLLLSLFTFGFQTQVSALAFLLLEILCLISAYNASRWQTKYLYLWLAGLVLAGSGFSWLFLYPISGALLAIAIIHTLLKTRKLPIPFVIGTLITGAFILYQPLVQILVKVPAYQDNVTVLNQRGHVMETSLAWIVMASAVALLFAYLHWRQRLHRLLTIGIVMSLVFSLGLMWYQLGTIHELRYYYFKSTYTIILLCLIMLAAAIGHAAAYLMESDGPFKRWRYAQTSFVVVAMVVFAYACMPLLSTSDLSDVVHRRLAGISRAQAATIADIVQKQPDNAWRILSIGSCNRGDDIRATLFANAISTPPKGPYIHAPESIPLDNIDIRNLFFEITKFINTDSRFPLVMIILSNDQVIGNQLLATLTPEQKTKIQFINLDPTPETETLQQCPDRVHVPVPTVSVGRPEEH